MNQPILKDSKKRKFFRYAAVTSVSLNLLYSWFFWRSASEATEYAIRQFGGRLDATTKDIIKYSIIPFTLANLISDTLCVDPLENADSLLISKQRKEKKEIIKLFFGLTLQLIGTLITYPAGSSSAALPIAEITKDFFNEELPANIINYLSIVAVSVLGAIYLAMFTNARLQRHVDEFIDVIKAPKIFLKNFIKNPDKYFEVWIQSLSNSIFRAISIGYVLYTVLTVILKADNKSEWVLWSAKITALMSFIITLFSRTLSVRDTILNPVYNALTLDDFKKAKLFRTEMLYDLIFTLIRAGSTSTLIFQLLPVPIFWKYSISAISGLALTIHGSYVGYSINLAKNALIHKKEQISLIQKGEEKEAAEDIALLEKTKINEKRFMELFNEIVKVDNPKYINLFVDTSNIMARIIRFIAFFLFVATFNEIFNFDLQSTTLIALTFLWGAEVFKNDAALYKESLLKTMSHFSAKFHLEAYRRNPEINQINNEDDNIIKNINCNTKNSEKPKKSLINSTICFFKALTKSPYDYSIEEVENTLRSLESKKF